MTTTQKPTLLKNRLSVFKISIEKKNVDGCAELYMKLSEQHEQHEQLLRHELEKPVKAKRRRPGDNRGVSLSGSEDLWGFTGGTRGFL